MSEAMSRCSVLLPCSAGQSWVVPQRCLGEIVTMAAAADQPPREINWRGELVPVVDFGSRDPTPWRDQRSGSGLIAVVLGQRGETCRYFGLAVRGDGLGFSDLSEDEIEDLPEAVQEYAVAAFRMHGNVYQVPDLLAVQRAIAGGSLGFEQ